MDLSMVFLTGCTHACTLPSSQGGYDTTQGSLEGCTTEDCSNPVLLNVRCAFPFHGTPQIRRNFMHPLTGKLVTGACSENAQGQPQWMDLSMVFLTGCTHESQLVSGMCDLPGGSYKDSCHSCHVENCILKCVCDMGQTTLDLKRRCR